MNGSIKILTTVGSVASIGFGIWHFFVPKIWNWYSYIDKAAQELVLAIRAINIFFSLSLVLFGIINLLFVFKKPVNTYALSVILAASSILWATRFILQIIYPQASYQPVVQYCLLATFITIWACFTISLMLILHKTL